MKILVCGGRDFCDENLVYSTLSAINEIQEIKQVVHGAARGADSLADKWAKTKRIEPISYPAQWQEFKRAAGPIRNREMIKEMPKLVVAFPGGTGTSDMISVAKDHSVPVLKIKSKQDLEQKITLGLIANLLGLSSGQQDLFF